MPLRKFFADRGANHPVAYSMLVLSLGMIACMAIAVVISVQASNRAIKQNIAQERLVQQQKAEADRIAQEKSRAAACVTIKTMIDVYTDPTPSTVTGRQAGVAWRNLGVTFKC